MLFNYDFPHFVLPVVTFSEVSTDILPPFFSILCARTFARAMEKNILDSGNTENYMIYIRGFTLLLPNQ